MDRTVDRSEVRQTEASRFEQGVGEKMNVGTPCCAILSPGSVGVRHAEVMLRWLRSDVLCVWGVELERRWEPGHATLLAAAAA